MNSVDISDLFSRLLLCRQRADIRACLDDLGDADDVGLDVPFGPHGLRWTAFGRNPSNISTIGLGTKPGKSLTERLTNAMDALLEERAQASSSAALPDSPRAAAQAWFGRAISGPDAGLYKSGAAGSDKRVAVVLLDSGEEDRPTIDVLDEGIGIAPDEMPNTILSLQAGNKIKKRYQIGAFGQGGSSTLGFAEYVLIASRHKSNPQQIGFTLIRVLKLDVTYKEDCYAYLTDSDGRILQFTIGSSPLVLYSGASPNLTKGTLVRHICYRLTGISKSLAPSPGNLYHYLHYSLLDPILPFRVWDLRASNGPRDEYVGGSRNRLMKLAETKGGEQDVGGRVQVRHYRAMEYMVPSGAVVPCIGVEYWIVLAFRKRDKDAEDDVLRANSSELFVQHNYPIIGTLNGQTQGELTGSLLKEIGLTLLSRHMVVHIDASGADSSVRRQLFSTSREGFKEGPVLDSIVGNLRRMLEEDAALFEIEKELTERIAKKDTATTREEVRQQVTRLLKEAGLQVGDVSKADVSGDGPVRPIARERKVVYRRRDPLPTLPYPQVTYLRFVSPDQHLAVAQMDSEVVLLETDADAEFDRRGAVAIRSSDNLLEVESKAPLSGGRVRWRLRPASTAKVGDTGELTASITKPNGEQVTASISFEVLAPKERPTKTGKTTVPPFEIKAISPEDAEDWEQVWPDDVDAVSDQRKHAYRAINLGGKTWVYYSTIFEPYQQALERLKATKVDLVHPFTTAYEVWIAYHAILQMSHEEEYGELAEKHPSLFDQERMLVATMQVKQALQYAEVWKKGFAASAS